RRLAAVSQVFLKDRPVALRQHVWRVLHGNGANGCAFAVKPVRAYGPFKGRRIHGRFHFVAVTVVPRPGRDEMSNSSMMRLTPGNPKPRPPQVEYPACAASLVSAIPGPRSLATTVIPRLVLLLIGLMWILPCLAYVKMLRVSSEIAVATRVPSQAENPNCRAISRPSRRAVIKSLSDATGTHTSCSLLEPTLLMIAPLDRISQHEKQVRSRFVCSSRLYLASVSIRLIRM